MNPYFTSLRCGGKTNPNYYQGFFLVLGIKVGGDRMSCTVPAMLILMNQEGRDQLILNSHTFFYTQERHILPNIYIP